MTNEAKNLLASCCHSRSFGAASAGRAGSMVLENAWFKITVEPASGSFSLGEKDGGRTVLSDGQWAGAPARRRWDRFTIRSSVRDRR